MNVEIGGTVSPRVSDAELEPVTLLWVWFITPH